MKKEIKCAAALVLILLTTIFGGSAAAYGRGLDPDPDISRRQLEAQVGLFHEVLVNFTAPSPERALELWVRGDRTRNGVYKYAVACDPLRQRLLDEWGPPDQSFWIIGGSSPWLTGHRIVSKTQLSPAEIQYVVQYEWASSAGPEAPSEEQLTLIKTSDGWCVKSFVQSDGYHSM